MFEDAMLQLADTFWAEHNGMSVTTHASEHAALLAEGATPEPTSTYGSSAV